MNDTELRVSVSGNGGNKPAIHEHNFPLKHVDDTVPKPAAFNGDIIVLDISTMYVIFSTVDS